MTEPMAGLIQGLKQDGVKLDNVMLPTNSFCFGMRKILFTERAVQF